MLSASVLMNKNKAENSRGQVLVCNVYKQSYRAILLKNSRRKSRVPISAHLWNPLPFHG